MKAQRWMGVSLMVASLAGCGGSSDSGNGNPPPTGSGSADISVAGSVLAPLAVGGGIADYRMTVANAGPDSASNIALTTSVDGGQSLGTIVCAAGGGAVCPASPGAAMTIPSLPKGGTLNFSIPATIPADSGTFSASMTAVAQGDPVTSNNTATASVTATARNSVHLASDSGDYIGAGQIYDYTQTNAQFGVTASGGHLALQLTGDQSWSGDFQLPQAFSQLTPGQYQNLTRYPFNDPAVGGLSWTGEGRGCNTVQGSLTITSATYSSGALVAIDLAFEQHCEGMTPALRGQIHWTSIDRTAPPGPIVPPPAGLWSPAAGSTPASGNYVYLQSDFGDYIGAGNTFTFTQANAILTPTFAGSRFSLNINAGDQWTADFQAMTGVTPLQPGYYGGLQRYPFNNPTKGGLDVDGAGRGCNQLTGWFVIDSISIVNNTLSAIDLRFEQHCEGAVAALHGKIHWAPGDSSSPPGPLNPPPAGLWQPAPGVTPTSGNFIYLQSDAGDYIGAGSAYTYTSANAPTVSVSGAHLVVSVDGWNANFQAMIGLAQLQPGYYGNVTRWPFHNPATGGMDWSGQGRGCNQLTGWFVIDNVSYVGNALGSLDLRFEQHCEGGVPALHGQIHWVN